MKQLSGIEITIVEAVYLCIIKQTLPIGLEEDLIQYIYDKDHYMYGGKYYMRRIRTIYQQELRNNCKKRITIL